MENYDSVIIAMCRTRRTFEAVYMVKKMLVKAGLTLRRGTGNTGESGSCFAGSREVWKAVEMI